MKNLPMFLNLLFLVAYATLWGCETVKPYEKEYLTSPLMNEATEAGLQPKSMAGASARLERSQAGAAGSGGESCPTCGG